MWYSHFHYFLQQIQCVSDFFLDQRITWKWLPSVYIFFQFNFKFCLFLELYFEGKLYFLKYFKTYIYILSLKKYLGFYLSDNFTIACAHTHTHIFRSILLGTLSSTEVSRISFLYLLTFVYLICQRHRKVCLCFPLLLGPCVSLRISSRSTLYILMLYCCHKKINDTHDYAELCQWSSKNTLSHIIFSPWILICSKLSLWAGIS